MRPRHTRRPAASLAPENAFKCPTAAVSGAVRLRGETFALRLRQHCKSGLTSVLQTVLAAPLAKAQVQGGTIAPLDSDERLAEYKARPQMYVLPRSQSLVRLVWPDP